MLTTITTLNGHLMSGDNKRGPYNRFLTGKGGVGLAMFQLAKRRIEFAMTWDNCPIGDLWIEVRGAKFSIEVKTCRGATNWLVSRAQIGRADFYCFVSMENASCYIATSDEVKAAARSAPDSTPGIAAITDRDIGYDCREAWSKITAKAEHKPWAGPKRSNRVAPRTVRRTLADGSVKTYTYAPYAPTLAP